MSVAVKFGNALAILGACEIRRWIRRVTLVSAGLQRSSDVVLSALVRARFCELLSQRVGRGDSDLFLQGLLSMMDVILEVPMAQILEHVPVDSDTKTVLLGGASPLSPVYQLMLARECGPWGQARDAAGPWESKSRRSLSSGGRHSSGRARSLRAPSRAFPLRKGITVPIPLCKSALN
jgi:EAL and modified HD-GYP domain-containing signal transduction protein